MSKTVTRRKFLKNSAQSSFAALSVRELWAEVEKANIITRQSTILSTEQRKLLQTAADEIIPAADGMLSAGQAGVVDYIEILIGKVPDLQKQLQAALSRIEAIAGSRFKLAFDQLNSAQRVKALEAFEKESARSSAGESLYSAGGNLFAALRDLVYEGYYTSPKVWPQLGYQFHPTSKQGPVMEPFDESALAQVRNRPKNYREVKR